MSEFTLDIGNLYKDVFGIEPPILQRVRRGAPFPGPLENGESKEGSEFNEIDLSTGGGLQEPPLKGDFNFKSPQGGTYMLPIKIGTTPINHWQFPNEPMVSIKGGKMLKVTPIRRGKGRGTVTEERGLKDYDITIKGLAINETENDYPEDQIRNIRRICEAEGIVYLKSYLTDLYNISKISIKDFDFPRYSGNSLRVQPYVITAKSDMDFDDFKAIINGG